MRREKGAPWNGKRPFQLRDMSADRTRSTSLDPASGQDDWHGWSRGSSAALHIGYLPGRKSCCLYTLEGSVLRVRAFFRNEDDAYAVLSLLDQITEAA